MRLQVNSMNEFDIMTNPKIDGIKWTFIEVVQELTNTANPDSGKDADLLFAAARFSLIGELMLL